MGKINDAYQVVKNGLEVEIRLATVEQKDLLANAKLALVELKDQIADLKDKNTALNEKLKKRDTYVISKSVYWLNTDTEENQPYCPACYANDRIVPLYPYDRKSPKNDGWGCPGCKQGYSPFGEDHDVLGGIIEF